MAQIDPDLYKSIADAYALIDVALAGISTNARTAVDAIIDITTGNYPDPSADSDKALEIELALLQDFNSAYVASQNLANSTGSLLDAIRTINNYVINNSGTGAGATAAAKLDTWINEGMTPTWASVPTGWKNLCEDAGYDVTNWT